MSELIERKEAIEAIKKYGKDAISAGKRTLDPVDDTIELCNKVEQLPAALHRAEPEMRPLTLEEIWEAVDDEDWNFVWLEYNLSSYTLQIIPHHRSKTYFYFLIPGVDEEGRKEPMVEINKEWRCWPRKPTPEQMAAEKWEEDITNETR